MSNSNATTEQPQPGSPSRVSRVLASAEGKVLVLGVVFAILYVTALLLAGLHSGHLMRGLVGMTGLHVIGGRALSISSGYNSGIRPAVVIAADMAIETVLVLLFYPLFVFSYRKLIVIKPLEQTMARARHTAMALQPKIMKFGIPGLLLFVWFPLWMTGPLVGCIIGFLIGMRPWVNLSVVLCGTYMAIVCWGILFKHLQDSLARAGPYLPLMVVLLILLVAIAIRIRYAFSGHGGRPKDEEREEPKGV